MPAARSVLLAIVLLSLCDAGTPIASNHTTGQFTIVFIPGEQHFDTFSVFHRDEPHRELWATDSNHACLSATYNKEDVYQNGGIFEICEGEDTACSDVRIQNITDAGGSREGGYNRVVVTGNFCGVCAFAMEFVAADVVFGGSYFQHLNLLVHVDECHREFNSIVLQWKSGVDESFYGFGHQFTHFNMKGHRLPVFLREKGVGRGLEPITAFMDIFGHGAGGSWHTTYTQVPFYVSSAMRSFVLESPEYVVFDMTQPELVRLELMSLDLHARIIYG